MNAPTDPFEITSATRSEARVAASVMCPPVSALPTVITSGAMPAREWAQRGPVRKNPAAISSKTSTKSCSSQMRRIACR